MPGARMARSAIRSAVCIAAGHRPGPSAAGPTEGAPILSLATLGRVGSPIPWQSMAHDPPQTPFSAADSPDALLIAAAAADESAFAAFYDATIRLVYGVVAKVARDPARTEEIVQETYFQAWRQAPRFDPSRGSAVAWLTTIAHRRAVDAVRTEQASRDRLQRAVSTRPGADFDAVVAEVEDAADAAGVRAALSRLTSLQREAIELAYFEGYTYREVAEMLDAPLGTVKTRLRDGLRTLGRMMGSGDG